MYSILLANIIKPVGPFCWVTFLQNDFGRLCVPCSPLDFPTEEVLFGGSCIHSLTLDNPRNCSCFSFDVHKTLANVNFDSHAHQRKHMKTVSKSKTPSGCVFSKSFKSKWGKGARVFQGDSWEKSMFTHEITGINFRTFWTGNSAGDSAFVFLVQLISLLQGLKINPLSSIVIALSFNHPLIHRHPWYFCWITSTIFFAPNSSQPKHVILTNISI